MRVRGLALIFGLAAVGCGLDLIGTAGTATSDGTDASIADGAPAPQVDGGSTDDASDDGAIVDAEADRPDAGVPFSPLHIGATAYDVNAPDFTVNLGTPVRIDTKALTIKVGNAAPAPSPYLLASGNIAVWSVGALSTFDTIEVVGDRPLAIVAIRDVSLNGGIDASAKGTSPGPGGSTAGDGAGKPGARNGADVSGGGGAGHGQIGGKGGDRNSATGGAGGGVYNASGAALAGGSGGGAGGAFVSAATCNGAAQGGAGGGGIQISSAKSITVNPTGSISVNGGGARGGCRGNGGNQLSGGGGGGSGGTVFLEAVSGITMLGSIDARGGGGGEGGAGNANGNDGSDPSGLPIGAASGGSGGGNGGDGGDGGVASSGPANGAGGNCGGGGGGGIGRVFFRTRGSAPTVTGPLGAVRTDDPSF